MAEHEGNECAVGGRGNGLMPRKVPIVAMTANVFREDIKKCMEAGMDDHVGKPLDIEEVLGLLRKYIRSV
jgi:CheY-like chemotaxis protein